MKFIGRVILDYKNKTRKHRIAVTHSEEETAIKIKNPDTSRREAD